MFDVKNTVPEAPLYRESFEHDNCGIGACVNIKGQKSHATVENALKIVENLEHRAGKDAEGKTGDGIQGVCDVFLERVVLIRDSRNASLRFRRTRYERIAFAEHRDLPVFRRPQSKT